MIVIGLTGGVGSGKTDVLNYIHDKFGASIIQADDIAKKLQKKGGDAFEPIVEYFGEDILDDKGELDRKKLSAIVFDNRDKLEKLNSIVHPAVKEKIKKLISKEEKKNTNLLIIEAALIIEAGYEDLYNELWYVYVSKENRKNRLIYSRGYSEEKVDSIISNQLPKAEYLKYADRVIDNNGIFAETTIQIDKIMKEMYS
ncbi:MAG: dephospho-CoA kinase [Lachnospiraceae bacterium]|jgi:dephospho-CoA kinase|nr:dephospho-CoA kinase [Lachnospiraceae bacterium]